MAIKSLPWPYTPGVGPTYSADDWANVWSWLGRNTKYLDTVGVLGGVESLQIDQAMTFPQVRIFKGAAMVGGRFVQSDTNVTLSVSPANPIYKRIDLLVLRTDVTNQSAELAIREGTPGPAPVAPAPVRDNNPYYELPLYELHVRPGATSWQRDDFQDVRTFWHSHDRIVLEAYVEATYPVNYGSPVFFKLATPPSSIPLMLHGTTDPAAISSDAPLLGVALHSITEGVVQVLSRGVISLRLTESMQAGDVVVVAVYNDNSLSVGRTPSYSSPSSVKYWRPLGIALTSAQANEQCLIYVDPLTYHISPREWDDNLTSDKLVSTSSVTVLTVEDIRIRTPYVGVAVSGVAKHSAAGGECSLSLKLDNAVTPLPLNSPQLSVANQWQNVSFETITNWAQLCYYGGLAPGDAHTFKLIAYTNTGTLTLGGGLQFRVREVRRGGL